MKKSLAFVILSTIAAIGLVFCFGVSKSYCQEGLILPHADAGGAVWNVGQLNEWNQDFDPYYLEPVYNVENEDGIKGEDWIGGIAGESEDGGFFDLFTGKNRCYLPQWETIYYGFDSYDSDDISDDYAFMAKPRFWRLNRFKERLRGGNLDDGYAVNARPNRVTQDGWEEDELGPVHLWIRPSFPINSFGFLI